MSRPQMPQVSVVVPALDAVATIEECLRSLLALRYPSDRYEIVVVDNGSRDGTLAVLAGFGDAIVLVSEKRRGRSAARNAGIRRARGQILAFTDADCTVDPDWLHELVEPLDDPGVGIAGGRILARAGANDAELFGETIHDARASILYWPPPYVTTGNWASPRTVLEHVGLFDEGLRRCEDVELSYRIGKAGYSLVYRPEAVVYHRNKRSLLALCREGWQHGYYATPVLALHAEYVAAAQLQPATAPPPPGEPLATRYGRAFRAGKRVGRAMGSVRLRLRRSPQPSGSPSQRSGARARPPQGRSPEV
jgi:glycosyltransferase involved in cell wall biosynthesis